MPECTHGHQVPEGDKFCQQCGEPLSQNPPESESSSQALTAGAVLPGTDTAARIQTEDQSAPPTVTRETNGLAVAALVLGIVWLGWLGSLLAVIFGYIARGQIRRSPKTQTGDGLAVAGIVLGWVGLLILVGVGVLFGIARSNDNSHPATQFSSSNAPNLSSGSSGDTASPPPTDQSANPSTGDNSLPAGHWVVFLGSFSNESNAENAQGQFSSSSVPDAAILNSNDYTSLLPNFWVVYVDRGFQSAGDTLNFCHSLGFFTDHDCHGRYLSTAPGLDGHEPRFTASNGQ